MKRRAMQRQHGNRRRPAARRGPPAPVQRDGHFALDGTLATSAALLAGLGLVMNYSTTAALDIGAAVPALALRHWGGVVVAVLCLLVVVRLPLAFWDGVATLLYAVTLLLLAITPFVGIEANGARRWLAIPGLPISIQPSEPARLCTVLALALMLARANDRGRPRPEVLGRALALIAAPAVLLLLQPDLGGAIVLIAVCSLVLFVSGLPLRRLLLPGAIAVAAAGAYVAVRPYALARLRGFLDPWQHARDEGFQLVQSFVAFGRGGAAGVGLGDGRQKLFYLPEAHTDFILSVIGEELGLMGVLAVLGSFAALAIAGLRIAGRARDPYALIVASGMTALIVVPAAINAAVVLGLAPTTGLTLPFLSHGSNSLVCTAVALGILLRLAAREAPAPAVRVRGAATGRGFARA